MRLCFITPDEPSRTETFIRAQLEHLPHEIVHLFGHPENLQYETSSLRSNYRSRHPRRWTRALNLLPRFAEFRIKRRFFGEPESTDILTDFLINRRIDVVLAHYGATGVYASPACCRARVPLVVHFHGVDASQRQYIQSHEAQYRQMFRSASAVVAVSKRMVTDLTELGCPTEKLALCHYGPAPRFLLSSPEYESNRIIAVGRFTAKKAPHLTILAFDKAQRQIPDLELTMIGDGELLGVCKDLVSALNLDDSVTLVGPKSPKEICRQMSRSFLFVQHSVEAENGDREGTPVAILEASAAGLPVVATRHAGIPDVVVDNETGLLVNERDITAMSHSIVRMARDRRLCQQFGASARDRIVGSFSLDEHLQKLDRVLVNAKSLGQISDVS